jgi:hypothetical protein
VKAACDKVDSRRTKLGSDHVDLPKELTKVDLALLLEIERNKILNQRTRDAKKATDKALREAMRAIAKAVRETIADPGKSKAFTPPLLLTKTFYASPS